MLGRHRKKIQPWVTNYILDLCDKRRGLKKDKHSSTAVADEYRKTNCLISKRMREAEEKWIDDQCKTIKQDFNICDPAPLNEAL